ncbi:MAG: hypothetical protein ACI9H1_001939, partial [Polaribacter sp.]
AGPEPIIKHFIFSIVSDIILSIEFGIVKI